ncbi:MAG: histidine phosphatase family protein [Pseudomonadota bacterium]
MTITKVMLALLLAALMAGIPPELGHARADDGLEEHVAFKNLENGGYVLVMRHAHSRSGQESSSAVSAGCILDPGRGLDERGRRQVSLWQDFMERENIPVAKAYTSNRCRAWDTARALSSAVEPHPSQTTTDSAAIAAFKKQIEAELRDQPGVNIALVSHSNIAPLYGAKVRPGERELPEGVMSVIDPASWSTIARIAIRDAEDGPRVTVD